MASTVSRPPIHPLSALVTIALDGVWEFVELGTTATVGGLPLVPVLIVLSGSTCFLAVTLIERFRAQRKWGEAVACGLGMGVLAGVPYVFTGGIAGFVLLGWAGLHEIQTRRLPAPKPQPDNRLQGDDKPRLGEGD